MAASGTMTVTSRDLPLTAPSAPPMAARKASPSWTLGPFMPGAMVPAFNRREVKSSRRGILSEARAAIRPLTLTSHARRGRVRDCWRLAIFLPGGLDKRDLVDLLHCSDAGLDLLQRRFAQEPHSFVMRRLADLRRRPLFQNQFADMVGKIKQFVDGGAPMIASAPAFDAALPFIEGNVAPFLRIQAVILQFRFGVDDAGLAVRTNDAYQPLRQNAVHGGNKIVRLHTHVQEAAEHVHHVVGVHRC